MIRQPVQSSSLRTVGYDKETKVLEIEFIKGGVYQYFDVDESVYTGLIGADSKGTYFQKNIRRSFRYRRICRA